MLRPTCQLSQTDPNAHGRVVTLEKDVLRIGMHKHHSVHIHELPITKLLIHLTKCSNADIVPFKEGMSELVPPFLALATGIKLPLIFTFCIARNVVNTTTLPQPHQ